MVEIMIFKNFEDYFIAFKNVRVPPPPKKKPQKLFKDTSVKYVLIMDFIYKY